MILSYDSIHRWDLHLLKLLNFSVFTLINKLIEIITRNPVQVTSNCYRKVMHVFINWFNETCLPMWHEIYDKRFFFGRDSNELHWDYLDNVLSGDAIIWNKNNLSFIMQYIVIEKEHDKGPQKFDSHSVTV